MTTLKKGMVYSLCLHDAVARDAAGWESASWVSHYTNGIVGGRQVGFSFYIALAGGMLLSDQFTEARALVSVKICLSDAMPPCFELTIASVPLTLLASTCLKLASRPHH